MGTRAIIKTEGTTVAVYKHYDGYPSGTLPWLEKFNKEFSEKRGNDPMYKVAQLLRDSERSKDDFTTLDPSKFTGWGVVIIPEDQQDTFDMWEEYEYVLKMDGTVDTYHIYYSDEKKKKRQLTKEEIKQWD